MNTQADVMSGAPVGPSPAVSAALASVRPYYWSVRRELWENRAVYVAPLAAAAVFLFGFLLKSAHLAGHGGEAIMPSGHTHTQVAQPYDYAAGLIMAATLVIGLYYSVEALQSERRDRSILFWKSMPVSDRTTILAKASIPFIVVPLLGWSITTVTQFLMLLVQSAGVAMTGGSVAALWKELSPFTMSLLLIYHLITVHTLWQAPIYGWLMFISAWARRAAIVWATVPLLAIGIAERMLFGTSYVGNLIGNRFTGGPEAVPMSDSFPTNPMMHLTPGHFLMSAGLWIGLGVTAVFLAASVRLRRQRGPL